MGSATAEASERVGEWFDLYVDGVHRYVARRIGFSAAQDVVADTFRIAIERFEAFDPSRASASSWLLGIATNLVQHHWRDEQRRLRAYSASVLQRVSVDPLIDAAHRIDAERRLGGIAHAVADLPQGDRDVLLLVAWEGLTSAEVAAVLGIPAGTVRSRLNRVRTHLRAQIADSTEVQCER